MKSQVIFRFDHYYQFLIEILGETGKSRENENNLDLGTGSTSNLADFVYKLKKVAQHDFELNTSSLTIIGLAHAEMLRTLEPSVLPGLIRLSSIVNSRLGYNSSHSICIVMMSRLPWSKWEMESHLNSCPVIIKLDPYTKDQLSKLLTRYLVANFNNIRISKQCEDDEEILKLTDDFFSNFSDVILGTFHAVAKSFPQFVSAAKMVLPTYIKPIQEKKTEPDNSRALYRHVEPFLKKWLTTANLKEAQGQNFEEQMKINMRSYDHNPSLDGKLMSEEPKVVSRLSVELPFLTKFLLIAAYIASYNPVKSDKRFFMKHHGKFKKRVRQSASLAAHKRSSQLLGPKAFPLDRMLAIFFVIVDITEEKLRCRGGPSADILSQVSSLVSLNLLTHIESAGLDTPKYKCNVGLDFIRLVSKNVRFEIHKYLYDIDN